MCRGKKSRAWPWGLGFLGMLILFVAALETDTIELGLFSILGGAVCLAAALAQLIRGQLAGGEVPGLKVPAKAARQERTRQKRRMQQERELEYERRQAVASASLISMDSKRQVGSMVGRAIVGSIFGPGGTVVGAVTAKTKGRATFCVEYRDGRSGIETVDINSERFKTLIQYTGL